MGTQAFREADVLGPGRGKLQALWLFGGKAKSYTVSNLPLAQLAGCLLKQRGCRLEWDVGIRLLCAKGIDQLINGASVSAATPNKCPMLEHIFFILFSYSLMKYLLFLL